MTLLWQKPDLPYWPDGKTGKKSGKKSGKNHPGKFSIKDRLNVWRVFIHMQKIRTLAQCIAKIDEISFLSTVQCGDGTIINYPYFPKNYKFFCKFIILGVGFTKKKILFEVLISVFQFFKHPPLNK